MNNTSETNWKMIDSLTDETIDRSEVSPLEETFFARAKWRMPEKSVAVTIHIAPDVLAWFKAQGNECEQRMLAALRIYAQAHQEIVA